MVTILFAIASILGFRFRTRVALELKLALFSISWPFCADNAPADLSCRP
jgi:hypothetical protein